MANLSPRTQVGFFVLAFESNSPIRLTADLSVLNGCRRASGAGYQHGDRKNCLRGTRETVLNEIELWTKDFNKSPVFWLNGLAGTGKTTIAQTVSERAFADGLLGASFFCSRDFGDRSDLRFISPTLAFQLAHKYPTFRSILIPLLQSNPDVVHESLYSQMEKLIVEPLRSVGVSTVVVIDALDECKDDEPSSAILSLLGRFVKQIPRVKFFITGRPEPRIKTGFRLPLLVESTDVFVLHDVHPALVNDDIRLFLKHELSELAQRRRLEGWPSDEHVDLLCRRAAGFFVYAVATIKFLDNRAQLPKRRLEVIIGIPECTDHEGKTRFNSNMTLDSLYTSILETAFGEEGPEIHSKARSVVGAVVLLANPLPPSGIADLIGLDREEVVLLLTLVHSLLAIDEDFDQLVKPFHKSFPDFITDPLRCTDARFYISPGNLHFELVVNCLKVMNEGLEQNLLSLPDYALNSEVKDLEARIDGRISVALRYACQSWYNHLTMAVGDAVDVVSHLRVFLENKFLAWLEVLSVLGTTRGGVVALERVILWLQKVCFGHSIVLGDTHTRMDQVARNEELLDVARDYFNFVTGFFEPISVSAVHIYHSALELSPLSSIVRRFYYNRRHTHFPRVVTGIADSWNQSIHLSSMNNYHHYAWSPCGRFVAASVDERVEIRDASSSELVSTFTSASFDPLSELAYSPDGRLLAHLSDSLIIWDIQTGGIAKEVQCDMSYSDSMVWSLDGKAIGIIHGSAVCVYDVASGTMRSIGGLQSRDKPWIWAHDGTFRTMAIGLDGQDFAIEIFEVGFGLSKIESFRVRVVQWGVRYWIESFSPTTHRISIRPRDQLHVLDIRNSECLLEERNNFELDSFSSDGSLFAANLKPNNLIHIWKYTSGRYALWRKLHIQYYHSFERSPLQFSPNLSSILCCFWSILQVYPLDHCPIAARPNSNIPLAVISHRGTYMVTAHRGGSTIAITNLLSKKPPQMVDTYMNISLLAITGNILLVSDLGKIAAWRLTEEGTVDGFPAGRRVSHGNNIWAVPRIGGLTLAIEDQSVTIETEKVNHVYHTGTGEVLEPALAPFHYARYTLKNMYYGLHYPHYRAHERGVPPEDNWLFPPAVPRGWVKDPEGRHRLWLPVEWRTYGAGWLYDVKTLWFHHGDEAIIIKL